MPRRVRLLGVARGAGSHPLGGAEVGLFDEFFFALLVTRAAQSGAGIEDLPSREVWPQAH